ncbi:MAG: DUF1192 family protein [Rhodospirillales bacterium]|nr:DUF1192 family protein [Rhodospirillales bacterium]MDE2319530.1 DUF1192 domain-containing protein [Rhodospirillales bacterium]
MSEEDLPQRPKKLLEPPVLDRLGVEELTLYIAELEAEIARVNEAISGKKAHAAAASLFFKPPAGA